MSRALQGLVCGAALLASPMAKAAAPACGDKGTRDCFVGEVLVLDPSEMGPGGKPLVDGKTCLSPRRPIGNDDATVTADLCTQYALGGAANGADVVTATVAKLAALGVKLEVDQLVLFSAEYSVGWDPQFFREPGGKNPIEGIGLPRKESPSPHLGWVTFGATTSMDSANVRRNKLDCATGVCAKGFHTPLDALAQATANLYAPYVVGADPMRPLSVNRENKVDPPRPQWNAWLDLKSSPLGGNNWRDNGNGTVESAGDPLALNGVIAPYAGQRMLRFAPIDLYLMGLMSRAELDKQQPGVKVHNGARMVKGDGTRDNEYMGRKSGVIVEVRANPEVKPADFLAGLPPRDPGFDKAPRHVRQLWVMLARPGVDDKKNRDAAAKLEAQRVAFGVYYYLSTDHRGRVITRVDGADDGGLFELAVDEADREGKTFERARFEGGLAGKVVREALPPGSRDTITYLDLTTPGDDGQLVIEGFGAAKLGFAPADVNLGMVRLRTTVARSRAYFGVDDQDAVPIPSGRDAFLIPDGEWHVYGAILAPDKPITSITVIPSSAAAAAGELQLDWVRVLRSNRNKDSDLACSIPGASKKPAATPDGFVDEVDNCPGVANGDQGDVDRNGVGDACEDLDGDSIPNACDNCPLVANLDQSDLDRDLVGDRCDRGREERAACFLFPYSLGGRAGGPPLATILGGLGLLAAFIARGLRRRTRKEPR